MSVPIPLSVRLVTAKADRTITRDLRSLTVRSTAPGGFASAEMSLDRPLTLQPDEIAYYGRVYVYDARNAQVVWEGRLEDPERTVQSDGQIWRLSALGPSAHARDRRVPLIYVDRQLGGWVTASATARHVSMSSGGDSPPALKADLSNGSTFGAGAEGRWVYDALSTAGMALGRFSYDWDAGITDANIEMRLATGDNFTVATLATANTAGGSLAASRGGGTAITAGHDKAYIAFRRMNSNLSVVTDTVWGEFSGIVVRGLLKTAAGADITSGYSAGTVLASEVVKDLLGRLLTAYDGANAVVATTAYAIDQLAYVDGVDPAGVLDDLMALEPAYYWAAWESGVAGLHRFEWSAWPTAVRYEADVTDGFTSPGSAEGLYNAVRVRWRDVNGVVRTSRRTQTVPELSAAGLIREALVDLGADVGTSANATQAGDAFLAEHLRPPNAGTLKLARPVLDLLLGRMVMPWEIRPGALIRVRGVLPTVDSVNTTARDGTTTFKIASAEYSTDDAAATLELDSYSRSTSRALADLKRSQTVRRS